MQNYQEAEARLTGRCKLSRKLENNTYLERRTPSTIAIRLHQTDVVTYHSDGSCILNTGGWRTTTTKDRLNKYSPVYIWQENSIWYVSELSPYAHKNIDRFLYKDDMRIDTIGVPVAEAEIARDRKAIKTLKARIKAFAKLCADNCIGVRPGPGDCWYCSMVTKDERTRKGTVHLDNHMTKGYPVPSLIHAACKRFGVSSHIMSILYHGGRTYAEYQAKESVNKSVRRYMYEQFGLAS